MDLLIRRQRWEILKAFRLARISLSRNRATHQAELEKLEGVRVGFKTITDQSTIPLLELVDQKTAKQFHAVGVTTLTEFMSYPLRVQRIKLRRGTKSIPPILLHLHPEMYDC